MGGTQTGNPGPVAKQDNGLKVKEFEEWQEFQKTEEEEDGYLYVEGYAAKFGEIDYHGEMIAPGAFDETMEEYMKNPVVLADHKKTTDNAIGRVVDYRLDNVGPWVRVRISKARDEKTQSIRQKIIDGVITGFSIGGRFLYEYGSPIIKRVKLNEISLTPTPAIKGAQFGVSMAKCAEMIREEAEHEEEPKADPEMETKKNTGAIDASKTTEEAERSSENKQVKTEKNEHTPDEPEKIKSEGDGVEKKPSGHKARLLDIYKQRERVILNAWTK